MEKLWLLGMVTQVLGILKVDCEAGGLKATQNVILLKDDSARNTHL